jgi:transposase
VHALATVDALPPLRRRRRGRENRPSNLFADRGYDADWLRQALRQRGINPHIPHKKPPGGGRVRDHHAHQRWPIEHTNAWLHNHRRLSTRWQTTTRALPRLRPTRRLTHHLPPTQRRILRPLPGSADGYRKLVAENQS